MEILLEKNRSKKSDNVTNVIPVSLEGKSRLLNNDSINDEFSLIAQYDKERDESERFRFTIAINPICSNVLFNMKTEAYTLTTNGYYQPITNGKDEITWRREGISSNSRNSINKTTKIDARQIIRDTEYSFNPFGGFKYLCGLDIFNNHILRRNGFCHVNKPDSAGSSDMVFNTFADYLRNDKGEIIQENHDGETAKPMHLYNADNLMSFRNAFLNKCKEQNGWFGFYNATDIETPNAEFANYEFSINRVLMDKEPCEFVELFPDHTYYTFVPQWNDACKRAEKNWDYCFLYPYQNDEEKLYEIFEVDEKEDGVPLKGKCKLIRNNGKKLLEIRTLFKHNLVPGSVVHLFYYNDGNENKWGKVTSKRGEDFVVETVGDGSGKNKDNIFTVSHDESIEVSPRFTNGSTIFFKRVSNGEECSYYFRKFKKIKNSKNKELSSVINKIAFGENIYGDETAQIVFTDDVNVEGLVDNLGRPVSEVFFSVFKRNEGYKKWYSSADERLRIKASDVERSRFFGEVTSGLDFSGIGNVNDEPDNFNIHYLNNLGKLIGLTNNNGFDMATMPDYFGKTVYGILSANTCNVWGKTVKTGHQALEENITEDGDVFYGDIVEFDKFAFKETVISYVYHRFNTAQREVFCDRYRDILEDVITRDDYDVNTKDRNGKTLNGFSYSEYYLNDKLSAYHEYGGYDALDLYNGRISVDNLFFGNVCPEGYYYKPFYSIKIRNERSTKSLASAKVLSLKENTGLTPNGNKRFIMSFTEDYDYKIGDTIIFYTIKNETVKSTIIDVQSDSCEVYVEQGLTVEDLKYILFVKGSVPEYAILLVHSGYLIWRDLVSPSEIMRGEDLYDTPFMNGRFYMEKNINFFLRRQDPFGEYGLSAPIDGEGVNQLTSCTINAKTKKIDTSVSDMVETGMEVCY